MMIDLAVRRVRANGINVGVSVTGDGPDLLLLHGFPHTRRLWDAATPGLARERRVIAADLRGLGGTSRAADGYDAITQSDDILGVLDALDVDTCDIAAIDAGVPPAFAFALRAPHRVRRLVLMESTLGALPGAEDFFAAGAPWWFGFHQVPGLAEAVIVGHEAEYLDFFFRTGTHDGAGIDAEIHDAFVESYRGHESLRCAFEHYRAMPESSRQFADLAAAARLTMPTLAIGAKPVGDALFRQLRPIAEDLRGEIIADCGHIIPLDRPAELVRLMIDFLGRRSSVDVG